MEGTIEKNKLLSIVLGGPVMTKWSVQCETNSDGNLLERISLHSELASEMMYALFQVSDWKEDGRYSAKACGEKAYKDIVNLVNEFIDYMETEDLKELMDRIKEYKLDGDE